MFPRDNGQRQSAHPCNRALMQGKTTQSSLAREPHQLRVVGLVGATKDRSMPVNFSLPLPITLCLNDLFSCYIIHISDLQQLNLSVIHSQAHFVEKGNAGILPKDRRHCAGDTLQLLQKPFPLGQVYCKRLCDPHTSADIFVQQASEPACLSSPSYFIYAKDEGKQPRTRISKPGTSTHGRGEKVNSNFDKLGAISHR